jgi:hypothetical protein
MGDMFGSSCVTRPHCKCASSEDSHRPPAAEMNDVIQPAADLGGPNGVNVRPVLHEGHTF